MDGFALCKVAHDRFKADFDGRCPLAVGVADGVAWVTALAPTVGINGYAMVPAEGHPWSNGWPFDGGWGLGDVIDVHGGVTWASHPWIGFDTAHAWDWWPPEYDKLALTSRFLVQDGCIRWTPQKVAAEAEKLAVQVARIGREAQLNVPELGRFRHLDVRNPDTDPQLPRERRQG